MKIGQLGTDSLPLAPITAATTARTATVVDTAGANYATLRVVLSAEASTHGTNVPITIAESDDATAGFSTFNTSFQRTVDNTAARVATSHIDLDGRKRYLQLTVTPGTVATADAVISTVIATLYKDVITTGATMLGPDVVIG